MLKPHFSIATIYRLILMILLASGGASDRLQAAEIDPSQVPSATGQSTQTGSPQPTEIYVFGEQPVSTATEASVRQKDFELRPTGTPVDILTSSVPGLYTVQHQGGGKADEYLIRGFDADHGTDFAIYVDGIPVNIVQQRSRPRLRRSSLAHPGNRRPYRRHQRTLFRAVWRFRHSGRGQYPY